MNFMRKLRVILVILICSVQCLASQSILLSVNGSRTLEIANFYYNKIMLRNFANNGYTIQFYGLEYKRVNDSVYYVKSKSGGGTIEILNESDSVEVASFDLSVVTKFVIPDIKFKPGYRTLELGTMLMPYTDSFYCEPSILRGHNFEELYYRIISYHFSIYREGTCIYTSFNEGNRLSESIKHAIGQARYKDRFILTDIKVTDNYGNLFTIPEYRAMCCY